MTETFAIEAYDGRELDRVDAESPEAAAHLWAWRTDPEPELGAAISHSPDGPYEDRLGQPRSISDIVARPEGIHRFSIRETRGETTSWVRYVVRRVG